MQRIDLKKMESSATAAEDLLKILANRNRLLILCSLVQREHTVGELEQLVGLSQSALSQHLARLREAGVVNCRREAQRIYYSIADMKAKQLLETLYSIYCSIE